MAGSEIRLDADRVLEVLKSVQFTQRDLLEALRPQPDVSLAVMGQPHAVAGANEFLSQWSEGRERISDALDQVHAQGSAAVTNLRSADEAIQGATY